MALKNQLHENKETGGRPATKRLRRDLADIIQNRSGEQLLGHTSV
jgi:predicted Rdx family selenoprotein